MVELSIKTVAIILIFLVIAAISIIFIFNIYTSSTSESESFADISESMVDKSLTGQLIKHIEGINRASHELV